MLTVYELPDLLYSRIKPLFADVRYDEPFRDVVFEGKYDARVFVDDPETPTAALIGHGFEFYIAGAVETPLRRFMADAPAEAYERYYGYATDDEEWKQALMADRSELVRIERLSFKWPTERPAPAWRDRLPDGGAMRDLDAALAERIDRDYGEHLIAGMGGREFYERYGFGACMFIDGAVAGFAYPCAVSDRCVNIGIFTREPFRRRGVALLAASAIIDMALARGLRPTWCCDTINPFGSAALARKVGFEEDAPYTQVSPWFGQTLPKSTGVWRPGPLRADGVVLWTRPT